MFATIRRYQGHAGKSEENVRRVKSELLPILTKQHGFVAYYLIEGANNLAVSLSIYEDRESADAGNQAAAAWVRANLSELVDAAGTSVGEVKVAAVTPAAEAGL